MDRIFLSRIYRDGYESDVYRIGKNSGTLYPGYNVAFHRGSSFEQDRRGTHLFQQNASGRVMNQEGTMRNAIDARHLGIRPEIVTRHRNTLSVRNGI